MPMGCSLVNPFNTLVKGNRILRERRLHPLGSHQGCPYNRLKFLGRGNHKWLPLLENEKALGLIQGDRSLITSTPSTPANCHSERSEKSKIFLNKGGPVSAKFNLMDFGFFLRSAPQNDSTGN